MARRTLPIGRQRLTEVLRRSGDTITVDDAAAALQIDTKKAARNLARWVEQGWLRRVSRGVYVAATMDSLDRNQVLADPWVLVPALYDPCYIGGRTAASHWDLTEQIFRDVVVMTARPVRETRQERHGATFELKRIPASRLFGTTPLWRGQTRIEISDVHRTIIDILAAPDIGGGLDHVSDCLAAYVRRKDADDTTLLAYGDRLGNSVVFKRLGFLLERLGGNESLIEACRLRIREGLSRLDPSRRPGKINSRWHLYLPASGKGASGAGLGCRCLISPNSPRSTG